MARFIQAQYPTEHAGVARIQRGFRNIAETVRSFDGARGAATLMLAAMVSALLVVANEVIETWTEGHLLAAWIIMWAVGFAAIALLAAPARRLAVRVREGLAAWAVARQQAREDARLWAIALTDARVCVFARADFDRFAGEHPALEHKLLQRTLSAVFLAGADAAGVVRLPTIEAPAAVAPALIIQSFYRFAHDLALKRGRDPDRPPHLSKVTETV